MSSSDVNQRYYGQLAKGREDYWKYMAAPRHRVGVLLRELARLAPESVVDLGCGGGNLLAEVAARFPALRLAGIDLSADQIAANRRAKPGVDWYAQDLMAGLPEGSELKGRFDLVIASELIEHVPEPARLVREASTLCRPGKGHVLVSTQSGPLRATEESVGHLRHFTAEEMSELLRGEGWEVLRTWNTGYPFHDLSKWWANRNPEKSMGRFGDRAYGPVEHAVCLALRGLFLLNSQSRGAQLFALAKRA